MSQDEQIAQQQATSTTESEADTSRQALEANQEQPVTAEGIPEKFLGKNAGDVIQSYQELEKDRGRIATELGDTRKAHEELEARFRDLEAQAMRTQTQNQQVPQQQVPVQQDVDPLSVLDSKFDDDPKAAIRAALEAQQDLATRQASQVESQRRATQGSDYYYSQKKDNPDYARLETSMQQLATKYTHMVKPEFQNSKEMLEVLYSMAKGQDLEHYSKLAVEKAQKDGLSTLEEKRNASTDTASSDGDTTVDPSKMTTKELEALLGMSDD